MSAANRRILIIDIVLFILAAAACVALFSMLPRQSDGHFMLTAARCPDGSWQLTWPGFSATGVYSIDVYKGARKVVSAERVRGENILLPAELNGTDCRIKIKGTDPADTRKTITLSEKIPLRDMPVTNLKTDFNAESGTLSASWSQDADSCLVYEITGDWAEEKAELRSPEIKISFNSGGDFSIPEAGITSYVGAAGVREKGRIRVIGSVYRIAEIRREDFRGVEFGLSCEMRPCNTAILSWEETGAESYEISVSENGKEFETLMYLSGEKQTFETPRLKSSSTYEFKVSAKDSNGAVIGEETAGGRTGITAVYSVVWLNRKLPVFSDPGQTDKICDAGPEGTFCVLEEDADAKMFKIRIADGVYGWVDSRYCMVNLPDYAGDLVSYDITNSYSSLFTLHEYGIDGLTGRCVPGYESVHQEDGSFLVPLLYPTAKKLVDAAQGALNRGYRLRLYDTYRPRRSTLSVYETTVAVLDRPIPSSTWTGNTVEIPPIPEYGRDHSILKDFVENGSWGMSAFLGYGGSNHNKGTAIDLGFEDAATGEIMNAQTMIHDLSIYSTTTNNNANAKLLKEIMIGFGTLSSEWWHFEDTDAMKGVDPSFRENGVSSRGWYFDGTGWKYRDEYGACLIGVSMTENGSEYRFDSRGYLSQ